MMDANHGSAGAACVGANTLVELMARRLPGGEREIVLAHASGCGVCRELLSELVRVEASVPAVSARGSSVVVSAVGREPYSASSPGPPLAPPGVVRTGELVANRYQVVQFLGAGGMGEVYEVWDRELEELVALKTLRRSAAARSRLARSFRRELRLVRGLSHPNICRAYDLGLAESTADRRPLSFFTMELVSGESLRARMVRGRLAVAEVVAIASQLASALDTAHAAGVVHRDVKPGNVMLAETASGVRAVLTDFGLAQMLDDLDDATAVAGTPGYIAPELLDGQPATASADIYAFGVVLYELVTGRRPYPGTALAALARAQREPPVRPTQLAAELPAGWDEVLLRCLASEPSARYATAGEVVAALCARPVVAVRARRRGLRVALAAAVVVGLTSGAVAWRLDDAGPPGRAPSAQVAVTRLAVEGPDPAWLGMAMTLALTDQLMWSAGATVQPRSAPLAAELDHGGRGAALDPERLASMARALNARYLVVGTVRTTGTRLDVVLQVYDAVWRVHRSVLTAHGSVDALAAIALDLTQQAAAVGVVDVERDDPLPAAMVLDRDTARLYAMAADAVEDERHVEAVPLIEQAAARAPDNPQLQSLLAVTHQHQGNSRLATAAAVEAMRLAAGEATPLQLWIRSRAARILGDWAAAEAALTSLQALEPDDWSIASDRLAVRGNGGDLVGAVSELKVWQARYPEVGFLDFVDSQVLYYRNTAFELALVSARRCHDKAARGHELILAARCQILEARILVKLGRYQEASGALLGARSPVMAAQRRELELELAKVEIEVAMNTGDAEGGRAAMRRARPLALRLGATLWLAVATANEGSFEARQGRPEASRRLYETAAGLAGQAEDIKLQIHCLIAATETSTWLGSVAHARSYLVQGRRAISVVRASPMATAAAIALDTAEAELEGLVGSATRAAELAQRALEQAQRALPTTGDRVLVANAGVAALRAVLAVGDVKRARALADPLAPLASDPAVGAHVQVAVRGSLSELHDLEGRSERALAELGEIDQLAHQMASDAISRVVALQRAGILLGLDRLDDADRALGAEKRYPSPMELAEYSRHRAELAIARGDARRAASELARMPTLVGMRALRWDRAITQARYEALIGRPADARRRLTSVVREATPLGFGQTALRAELARASLLPRAARNKARAELAKRAERLGVVHMAGLAEPSARSGR
jgi:eukaryotic-like serine/threonine-protein kinase